MPFLFSSGVALVLTIACGGEKATEDSREYTLQGQILSVTADHKEANIKHGEITGFMPAMTMPYKVREAKEFDSLTPGDLINATLVVVSNDAYLKDVKKVGQAPLEKPPAEVPDARHANILKEGEAVPATTFINQDGKKQDFLSLTGKALVMTFIYTRCPMPTFCPLMDRNFVELQQRMKADPFLNVHLLTVTFDPETDTPAVLKKHGQKLGADPRLWSFLTGDRDEVEKFAARFGVSLARAMSKPEEITHNLRTVLIDRRGYLVKTYTGNEWTPSEVMADIKILVGVD
jgi:protein SCO1/2